MEHNRIPKGPITDDNVVVDQIYSYGIIGNRYSVNIKKVNITKKIEADPEIQKVVDEYYLKFNKKMGVINCQFNTEIDVREAKTRTGETKIGNFLTDLMRKHLESDVAMINSGSLKAEKIYKAGRITIGDWYDILPYENTIVKLEITGDMLHRGLENGVSEYPELSGRFPQVSGVSFTFDASKKKGSRINKKDIFVGGKPLKADKKYTIACSSYIGDGKSGYSAIAEGKVLIDEENGPLLKQIVSEDRKSVV